MKPRWLWSVSEKRWERWERALARLSNVRRRKRWSELRWRRLHIVDERLWKEVCERTEELLKDYNDKPDY